MSLYVRLLKKPGVMVNKFGRVRRAKMASVVVYRPDEKGKLREIASYAIGPGWMYQDDAMAYARKEADRIGGRLVPGFGTLQGKTETQVAMLRLDAGLAS